MEIRKNGVRVARALQGDAKFPGSLSIAFKDTPDEDSEYDIRIKSDNDSSEPDIIRLWNLQTSLQIFDNPVSVAVTEVGPSTDACLA